VDGDEESGNANFWALMMLMVGLALGLFAGQYSVKYNREYKIMMSILREVNEEELNRATDKVIEHRKWLKKVHDARKAT